MLICSLYDIIDKAPILEGALHDRYTPRLIPIPMKFCGIVGGIAGIAETTVAGPVPYTFVGITCSQYVIPFVNPVSMYVNVEADNVTTDNHGPEEPVVLYCKLYDMAAPPLFYGAPQFRVI